jgi:2-oxoglutarate ferredoxin oxidoreductase subunit beta
MIEKAFYDRDIAWCPGCGDFPILRTLDKVIEVVGQDRKKLVLVSGIGQAAKLPHYTQANVFNGLHGRALPAAVAIKLANHELEVVVTSGDGDVYGEGGNHLLHNIRRNVGIKVFVHNNQVYGLTKGQASPTSDLGYVTPAQTTGVLSPPFNPLAVAVAEDCSFVARTSAGDPAHMQQIMEAALRHRGGLALVDILQPCVTFNKVNTYQWYRERARPVGDGHDPFDRARAFETALKWGDEIPIGIIYRSDRPSFESQLLVLQKGTLVSQYARR